MALATTRLSQAGSQKSQTVLEIDLVGLWSESFSLQAATAAHKARNTRILTLSADF
jgi:hypothetical protein